MLTKMHGLGGETKIQNHLYWLILQGKVVFCLRHYGLISELRKLEIGCTMSGVFVGMVVFTIDVIFLSS